MKFFTNHKHPPGDHQSDFPPELKCCNLLYLRTMRSDGAHVLAELIIQAINQFELGDSSITS